MYRLKISILSLLSFVMLSSSLQAETLRDCPPHTPEELYLDMIKRGVLNYIYFDMPEVDYDTRPTVNETIVGQSSLTFEQTMVGLRALNYIEKLGKDIIQNKIPGDFIETGVWRGGATIFMRALLKVYGITDRTVWVADSFQGVPPPNPTLYPADTGIYLNLFPFLAVPMESVMKNFEHYGLLDNQVKFLKGWFKDTLPTAPIDKIALLRMDGDLYESTMDTLTHLYPKVSIGGYIIVDDFGAVPACAQAVYDYRAAHGITEPIYYMDWTGVYWQKMQ